MHEPLKGGSRLSPGRRIGVLLLGLAIVLFLDACTSRDGAADEERRGGFYGGVSGGLSSHP